MLDLTGNPFLKNPFQQMRNLKNCFISKGGGKMTYRTNVRCYDVIQSNKIYRDTGSGIKLLISLHKIEFSNKTHGYYKLTTDIFVSGLTFLLYVRRVTAGDDFEKAKVRAKRVLLEQIEEEKLNLISESVDTSLGTLPKAEEIREKVALLDQALSIFKED
jgi:hypothetical protein